jgi:hypothetical protein
MIQSSKHHLSAAEESYSEHLVAALAISAGLARASLACALHALLPGLCVRTASRAIAELHQKLQRRAPAATPGSAEQFAASVASRSLDRRDGHRFSRHT